ncbi:hypothetical protein WA026_007317 [Henosepilachna vigintioctopunctata]|uniref:Mitochondrial import inner membrane translocase subunit Tim29 n=1 Tax=Henosepilachna vigintioctopunctata TaxID=420089 RepID=A0AAW1UY15_9CUCU
MSRIMRLFENRVPNIAAIEQKIKGTIWEKWLFYWKSVLRDYKDVAVGLKVEAKEKPKKAAGILTGFTFLAISAASNPNATSFRAKHIECINDLALVPQSIVNPTSITYSRYIEQCYNADLIRYRSFGLFSIIWVDTSSDKCKNYASTCEYLRWRYRYFNKQFIDIGFLGIWWVISRKMLDYDINY